MADLDAGLTMAAANQVEAIIMQVDSQKFPQALSTLSRRATGTREDKVRSVPLLLCAMPTRGERAAELHIVDYLNKPISRRDLLAAVEKIKSPVKHVLLVDDDPSFLRLVTRILRSTQRTFELERAYSGTEALARMRRHPPDLVILDLIMPGMDGVQVAEQMQREPMLAGIPVLIITAKSLLETEQNAAISLLATSVGGLTPTELVHAVHAVLDAMVDGADHTDEAVTAAARAKHGHKFPAAQHL